MTVIKPKSKSGRVLFFLILIVFAIGAFFYTGNTEVFVEHSAMDDTNALFYAFQALFMGDIDGFFDGLFSGIVVVGLFIVLFTLLQFLFTHPLKTVFPRKVHGTILALAITIYGFVDHRIYNYLLSLNAYAVGFLVFCAVVIMIWGFTDHSAKHIKDDHKRNKQLKELFADDKTAVKELKKLIRDDKARHRSERDE